MVWRRIWRGQTFEAANPAEERALTEQQLLERVGSLSDAAAETVRAVTREQRVAGSSGAVRQGLLVVDGGAARLPAELLQPITPRSRDPLTGLAGPSLYRDRLARAIEFSETADGADSRNYGVAVLRIEIDGWTGLRERLGTAGSDRLLVEVGTRLSACARARDVAARLSGEQFAIVQADGIQPRSAVALAERVARMLAEPLVVGAHRLVLSTRIGIALHPLDAVSSELLATCAEQALGVAREAPVPMNAPQGHCEIRFFDVETDQRVRRGRILSRELRLAMQEDELQVRWRVLRDGASMDVIGHVAYPQWTHRTLGEISSVEFLAVAEEHGLLRRLGDWLHDAACVSFTASDPTVKLVLRMGAAHLLPEDSAESLGKMLARSGMPPQRVMLSIPAGLMLAHGTRLVKTMDEFRELGVTLALAGVRGDAAVLSRLREFKMDSMILADELVQRFAEGQNEATQSVRALIGLGRALKMPVSLETEASRAAAAAATPPAATGTTGPVVPATGAKIIRIA
jgi:diguanylate cyclase (GGDEF)-like protein